MKFRNWIKQQGGPKPLALRMGINKQTIYSWLYRQSSPRIEHMKTLVAAGQGAFGYDDIIKETTKRSDR